MISFREKIASTRPIPIDFNIVDNICNKIMNTILNLSKDKSDDVFISEIIPSDGNKVNPFDNNFYFIELIPRIDTEQTENYLVEIRFLINAIMLDDEDMVMASLSKDNYIEISFNETITVKEIKENKNKLFENLKDVLIHELTHSYDVISEKSWNMSEIKNENEFKERYMHDRHELKAIQQSLVYYAKKYIKEKNINFKNYSNKNDLLLYIIKTYKNYKNFNILTHKEKKLILEVMYKQLIIGD